MNYDAVLFVSFGGPEGPDDVIPFLENVLRGRNVPRSRMLEVAKHYQQFGGISPINQQNRELITALEAELAAHGPHLPVYFGNRNWHPMLEDTLRQMTRDGVKRALAFVTSAFSSYSGCRQYRENIQAARNAVGANAPTVDKLRVFYNHPGFVEPMADNIKASLDNISDRDTADTLVLFTAHSIPVGMAENCEYERQLRESCRLVADRVGGNPWKLVYQSRSGPPHQPWLEPDVCDFIRSYIEEQSIENLVVAPIGFISDHIEVLFDLDEEARRLCDDLGVQMHRSATVGTHPRFVQMIRQLVEERIADVPKRLCLGQHGPSHDSCPEDCCLPSTRPARR